METIHNGLETSDVLLIMGVAFLGYLMLMGVVYVLFKMLFPIEKIEEPSPLTKWEMVVNKDLQDSRPTRVRKMRLAQ